MNMDKIMKQAQKMQAQMMKIQEELAKEVVEGESGGGVVKVKCNGQGDFLSISIEPDVIDPEDVEMLEDLILAAINDAQRKSKELANERLSKFGAGFGMPGLM
ncbi:MAG: YbaB/EbfC family nucleoid-associated protein [Acetomicrobium sp.]